MATDWPTPTCWSISAAAAQPRCLQVDDLDVFALWTNGELQAGSNIDENSLAWYEMLSFKVVTGACMLGAGSLTCYEGRIAALIGTCIRDGTVTGNGRGGGGASVGGTLQGTSHPASRLEPLNCNLTCPPPECRRWEGNNDVWGQFYNLMQEVRGWGAGGAVQAAAWPAHSFPRLCGPPGGLLSHCAKNGCKASQPAWCRQQCVLLPAPCRHGRA